MITDQRLCEELDAWRSRLAYLFHNPSPDDDGAEKQGKEAAGLAATIAIAEDRYPLAAERMIEFLQADPKTAVAPTGSMKLAAVRLRMSRGLPPPPTPPNIVPKADRFRGRSRNRTIIDVVGRDVPRALIGTVGIETKRRDVKLDLAIHVFALDFPAALASGGYQYWVVATAPGRVAMPGWQLCLLLQAAEEHYRWLADRLR